MSKKDKSAERKAVWCFLMFKIALNSNAEIFSCLNAREKGARFQNSG